MRVRASFVLAFLSLFAVFVSARGARAQTTTNVPVGHPAYAELDALRAAGIASDLIVGQRPYSRAEFAGVVHAARSRLGAPEGSAGGVPSELSTRQREALERLGLWFADELDGLSTQGGISVRSRVARMDLTALQSPWRSIPTLYLIPSDNIDGRLNPLVDGRLGRHFVDGWTVGLEAGVEMQLGRYLTAYAQPRFSLLDPRGASSDTDLTPHQLYLRSVLGNFAMEVGRDHVFSGHGFESGTFVSQNPRGFDMIRISNERPFRFPWVLGALGPTSLSFLASDLGSNRDIENALLFMIRASIRPHPNLELGLSSLNVQGGEGAPTGPFWDRVADVLVPGIILPHFSEKLGGLDARLTLPEQGMELYLEFTNTDPDFRRFTQAVTHETAWALGTAVPSFGPEGRFSARAEWRRNGFRPYTHHQYTSGLTLDGLIIGSPMGPAATGVAGQVGWSGTVHQLQLDAYWEQYRGDEYANVPEPGTGRLSWERVADNPDEVRYRLEGEWSRLSADDNFQPSVRLGWENVDRFDFGTTGRTNWMAAVTLEYRW